jgi:murein DD-endopeptidase MepM/ murein hydrolase activator NlpD
MGLNRDGRTPGTGCGILGWGFANYFRAPRMTGTDVDQYVSGNRGRASFRNRTQRLGARLATTDGRWALVSSSVTVLVAGAVAWMAMGTLPITAQSAAPSHASLPYELFLKLVHSGGADQLASIAPQFRAPVEQEDVNPTPGIETRTVTLDSGDTLAGAMEDVGVSTADAHGALAALGKDFNFRQIKAGMSFDITYNVAPTIDATGQPPKPKTTTVMVNHRPVVVPVEEDSSAGATESNSQAISRLLSLHFSPKIEKDVTVTRTTDGGFDAAIVQKTLEVHHHRAGATIDSSLYLSGMQADIPPDIVQEMMGMLAYKVDFQRDLKPGDSFEVYYDYYYTPEGQPAKIGDISYVRLRLGSKDITLYRYAPGGDSAAEYYDAKGQSAKGLLMKTPVDGARISSGFGSRFHPILGYTRMHKGVDFAVPQGTPVMAAGGGTIEFMGWANGYGNFVKIDHGNGYATGYGHLSRFAAGLRKGAKVRQGQVFAYSGMTGMATGPHLHYETFVHGSQVNPLTLKIAEGRLLNGPELRNFLQQRLKMDETLASMPLESKVSDIPADMRQAKAK